MSSARRFTDTAHSVSEAIMGMLWRIRLDVEYVKLAKVECLGFPSPPYCPNKEGHTSEESSTMNTTRGVIFLWTWSVSLG